MAITVKYLEELGLDKETAEKIFAERGKEIEADKLKREKLETELKESKESLETLNKEFENLKESNASAEDWRTKFEALQAENVAKEKQAEADRILKEKQDNILNRFNVVLGEKKFSHDAIRESYLKKFGEALESKDFEGKSDTDILHALTKDDNSAFAGVTAVRLAGGKAQGSGKSYSSMAEIMQIKDRGERRAAIAENIAKGNIE